MRTPTASARQDEFLRHCGELGVAFVPFFAVAGPRAPGVAGPGSAGALAREPHVLVVPGTDPDHLADNVAAPTLRLEPDNLARLDGPPWSVH